jgi:hypothetical protein
MNRHDLVQFFKDRDRGRYMVHFLKKPITITEVAKSMSIQNRNKLTTMIKSLSDYKAKKAGFRSKNSKPIQLEYRIIADYVAEYFTLNGDEEKSLLAFISEPTVNKFLLSNNKDLDQLLNKLILWIFKLDIISRTPKLGLAYGSTFDLLLDEGSYHAEKLDLEIALTMLAREGKYKFTFIDKITKSNKKIYISIKNIYDFIDSDLKGREFQTKRNLTIHNRLKQDKNLIYDPYTTHIQTRAEFMKHAL